MNKDIHSCIQSIVAYNGGLHIAHWRADTRTNEHKTLGDLYEAMIDLIDRFAECYMGKYEVVKYKSGVTIPDLSEKPCATGLKLVQDLENYFEDDEDEDLLNIIAEMDIALNKAKYLLKE